MALPIDKVSPPVNVKGGIPESPWGILEHYQHVNRKVQNNISLFSLMAGPALRVQKYEESQQRQYKHFIKENRSKALVPTGDLRHVFSFLTLEEVDRLWCVNKTFQEVVGCRGVILCRRWLNHPSEINPEPFLPKSLCDQEHLRLITSNIFTEAFWSRYIGEVDPIATRKNAISNYIKKWHWPDPCDPTKTIGREYILICIPEYVTITGRGISLDKTDDPNDPEAPRLIRNKEIMEETTLKVAITINNAEELFKCPKTGNPSEYYYCWKNIADQHGNKRIRAQWICMRRDVIGRSLNFRQQQALAAEKGVVVPELLSRILFNFMMNVRSKELGAYPDGQEPWTNARTATMTTDAYGSWSSLCGGGSASGLDVTNDTYSTTGLVGVAVALPSEVQAIDS